MTETNFIIVVTTVGKRAEARSMARELVERRLVACAQIGEIESFYSWQGKTQNDPEYRLLLKTQRNRYSDVEAAIRELHPYDLPAIHAVALDAVYAPYGEWIEASTTD